MKKSSLKYKLLAVMDSFPNGEAGLQIIFQKYEARYKDQMSPSDIAINTSGNVRWKHSLQGEITECRRLGYLVSPARGYWRITDNGRQWLKNYLSNSPLSEFPSPEDEYSQKLIGANNKIKEREYTLETFSDFFVPLMKILDNIPNRSGKSSHVLIAFELVYRDEISPHLYTKNKSGKIRWEHNVRWSREKLRELGLMDAPKVGIWRLTEKGHQWLLEHPDATHLTAERSKSRLKNKLVLSRTKEDRIKNRPLSGDDFFTALQENLQDGLRSILGNLAFEFVRRGNYLQIRVDGFGGCHYEIILRRSRYDIALHFESSAERSQARLRGFEPHLDDLSQALGVAVYGDSMGRGWTQVRVDRPVQKLSTDLAKEYAGLVINFVTATFPILVKTYQNENRSRRYTAEKVADTLPLHRILDQEVETILSYLQGRGSLLPSDEKLCDWVHFCYTFEMYTEGKDLFALVNGSEVNPWYYERTKKLARLCTMRAGVR